jgi:hypothetical protein
MARGRGIPFDIQIILSVTLLRPETFFAVSS